MATTFSAPPGSLQLPAIPDDCTLSDFILNATNHPARPLRPQNAPWLIEDHTGRRIQLEELRSRTSGLANALSVKWNIGPDSVVCLFSPNHVDYPVCIWALHTLGAIVTPANPAYTAPELVYQLETVKADLLVVHADFLSTALIAVRDAGLPEDRIFVIESAPYTGKLHTVAQLVRFGTSQPPSFVQYKLRPGEGKTKVAFYSFSSGTTGKPKVDHDLLRLPPLIASQAVCLPHYSVITNIIQKAVHWKINDPAYADTRHFGPGDVAIAVLPFFHIYGLVLVLHTMLFSGLSLVVVPKFSFIPFLESIVRHRVTHLFLVPPQIVLLCKSPETVKYDLRHVKLCISGAAPLSGELIAEFRKIVPNAAIGQGYGMTETCTTVCIIGPDQRMSSIGAAGQIIPGVLARVVAADGTLCSEGETGELVVTGPSIPLGYLNNEEASKETFVDGWVRTGDEVIIKNSEIFVVDRIKELIKVKGNQVSPADLEGHLLAHPAVADTCVVSVLDPYNGELPLAYVVLREDARRSVAGKPGAEAALKKELQKHVADHKISYKHLTGGVVFIDAIPKNPSGKILRRVLRDEARKPRPKM
ncbi:Phenylacetyl-CoA ligase [Mycena kentingensis (nom. inval.)]|nr:Phenylacetyl-CoA ligase [Mycena kentingensis (nom. inval.)]